MADIQLKDLQNRQTETGATADTAALATRAQQELEKKENTLTPEERTRVDEIKEQINLLDSSQAVTYGIGAQRDISDFSDTILARIRNKDTGEVGDLLTDLMVQVKDMEIGSGRAPRVLRRPAGRIVAAKTLCALSGQIRKCGGSDRQDRRPARRHAHPDA